MTVELALERFAGMNVRAAETFETLMQLVDGEIRLVRKDGADPGLVNLHHPLTDAFVFELWRAVRLANSARTEIADAGFDVDRYVDALKPLDRIRNVTEHGRDEKKLRRTARTHVHDDGAFGVDETSLIVLGSSKILRGGANLFDLYCVARDVADTLKPRPFWTSARYAPKS